MVNYCSPGNAWDIIEDYQKIDCRVKAVNHEKNKGLFQARLTGAQLAQGEYIAFVDSDDYISIDYYREMITQAVKGDFDVDVYKRQGVYRLPRAIGLRQLTPLSATPDDPEHSVEHDPVIIPWTIPLSCSFRWQQRLDSFLLFFC